MTKRAKVTWIVKWRTGGGEPYLVDGGGNSGAWSSRQRDARRFASLEAAKAHIRESDPTGWWDWALVFVKLTKKGTKAQP